MLEVIIEYLNKLSDKEICILAVALGIECATRRDCIKKNKGCEK